jgi:hypothetical protein
MVMAIDSTLFDAAENAGYFRMAIPSEWDDKIAQQITNSLSANVLAEIANKTEQRHWDILLYFAERAATLAVRRKDPKLLKLGLIAASLSLSLAPDWRDVLLVFPVLYHAAGMLGVDPAQLFREVGVLFGGEVESDLIDFLQRSDEDKSLKAMGYQLVQEPDGVRFKRTW